MKQYRRRIENLERAIEQIIRVIVLRDEEPDQVIIIRYGHRPHLTYERRLDENANTFLQRAGCQQIGNNHK